jgi:hypothetical protein
MIGSWLAARHNSSAKMAMVGRITGEIAVVPATDANHGVGFKVKKVAS